MQSVTFIGGPCARRTKLPRHGNARRDSYDVFVTEHVGLLFIDFHVRFELSVVNRADVAQTVIISLSVAAEKEKSIKPMVPYLSSLW